jgi:hypothetical protein
VLSQVPQVLLQQSLSWLQLEPSCAPDPPPQVLSHVPHVWLSQQSPSLAHVAPAAAQPHVPLAHVPPQQSVSELQLDPSWAPDVPPQVLSQVPHVAPLQQSLSLAQVPPELAHGLAHAPLVHTRVPQQSPSLVHVSPVPRHPQVPLPLHTLGEQQSELLAHAAPEPAQPQVEVPVSQLSAPQQSPLPVQPWPLVAQPHVEFTQSDEQQSPALVHALPSWVQPPEPPVPLSSPLPPLTHVLLDGSHVYEPQQSSDVVQSPPTPAHAGWHVPLAQLSEQQSPFSLQQSSSYWQSGSPSEQEPPSLLVPESVDPPLPLPPASLFPPLPLPPLLLPLPPPLLLPVPVPPSLPPPVPPAPHLPEVHESEQQLPYEVQVVPLGRHIVVPQTPFMQSLLQQSVLVAHVCPSGLHVTGGGPHVPELHELLQHSLPLVQLVPSFEHEADWHVPDTQSLLQQSVLAVQLPPMPAHAGWAHVPLVHVPLQQSLAP